MIPQKRKYFIITVHYGDPTVTEGLLESIKKSSVYPDQILLVDHGQALFKGKTFDLPTQVIRPQENSGYAGGINTAVGNLYGAGAQEKDIIICLNNDVRLGPHDISTIISWCEEKNEIGLIGPTGGVVNLLTGRTNINAPPSSIWHQLYIDGAFFCMDLKTFFDVKGLPDSFWMYWEDVELSKRVKEKGMPLSVVNLAATHTSLSSSSPQKTFYLVRNGVWYLENRTSIPWRLYWRIINTIRYVFHMYISKKKEVAEALREAREGQLGKKSI